MNTSLEAHKCGIGVLTREALVPIGSGPNSLCDGGGEDWDQILPYVAMGYRMSKQKAVGYNDSEHFWEPAVNLAHATFAVRDFHARCPDKPRPL